MSVPTVDRPDETTKAAGETVDLALVDNAVHRAEGLAVADPTSRLAEAVAGELDRYLPSLITPAERRLVTLTGNSPAQQRARDVLADSIQHARSVHRDEQAGAFTNPTARLYLLAGACRLLKHAMDPTW